MNISKRLRAVSFIVVGLCLVIFVGSSFFQIDDEGVSLIGYHKETITLWYTDDALTDYLNSKAVSFSENNDIRVETKLVSGLEYLEEINEASISEEERTPDIYIITNDSLEKAYLAGLATKVSDSWLLEDVTRFSETARNSVEYQGSYVGYPFYFETAALLYNKTYLEQIAQEAQLTDETSLIPTSIADIVQFADMYSAPENVEYFFRWDVSDIFYNYFFVGNYISVGGAAGDERSQINIYNSDAIASLQVYQDLNQFFSIESEETNYDSIMTEFLEGKTIYTIATSDCLAMLEQAKEDGTFTQEYGIAQLPNINQELLTKGMSVTNALVINGYSEHKEAASEFITYMLDKDTAYELYDRTGKLPARMQQSNQTDHQKAFVVNYNLSTPIPKMVETSNFWIELETCFAKVWAGADANAEIKALSEQLKTQVAGEVVEETYIETPELEFLPVEEFENDGEVE